MAAGGYQAPSLEDVQTGFGSESPEIDRRAGTAGAPLFGIDYKK